MNFHFSENWIGTTKGARKKCVGIYKAAPVDLAKNKQTKLKRYRPQKIDGSSSYGEDVTSLSFSTKVFPSQKETDPRRLTTVLHLKKDLAHQPDQIYV